MRGREARERYEQRSRGEVMDVSGRDM